MTLLSPFIGGKLAHLITREIRRREPQDYQPKPADRLRVALHEAAHAVASFVTGCKVGELIIDADGGGSFRAVADGPPRGPDTDTETVKMLCDGIKRDGSRPAWMFDLLVINLAPVALERVLGVPDWRDHCSIDIKRARLQAQAITATKHEAERLLDRALQRAAEIVAQHRAQIFALADVLAERSHICGDEINCIIRAAPDVPVTSPYCWHTP